MLEFCSANDLFVTNTGFRHHLRRATTWISPDGRTKNEIDYILIRFKSSALNCRTYPKAGCGPDHNIVTARRRLRFTAKKTITGKVRRHVDNLREEEQLEAYNKELAHVLRNTQSDLPIIDNQWETIKKTPQYDNSYQRNYWKERNDSKTEMYYTAYARTHGGKKAAETTDN